MLFIDDVKQILLIRSRGAVRATSNVLKIWITTALSVSYR